jgi:hypothetical protein
MSGDKIIFQETTDNEDFKKNVCIPYFKDIFKVSTLSSNYVGFVLTL